jgi:YidC/Oxa1 family membrane protein insertase
VTLDPLYRAVAWVIVQIHHGLSFIFPADSGFAWAGSIILLTVLMRILIFPLFVKQIHASRKMQELNPQVQALRKKYKNDKQRMNQEVMKLYQEAGANPLSGCLPLVVQFPVFISLFQVLNKLANAKPGNGSHGISADLVASAQEATIFGAHISTRFLDAWNTAPKNVSGIIVCGIAAVISSITTFFSVRASMARQPAMDESNPMASAQKMMVWFAPLFGLFGLGFPLGVLLYWVTSNTWTLAQTHYIHKRYPLSSATAEGAAASNGQRGGKSGAKGAPPAPAGGLLARFLRKQPEPAPAPKTDSGPKVVRQQPQRQSRSKRTGGGSGGAAGGASGGASGGGSGGRSSGGSGGRSGGGSGGASGGGSGGRSSGGSGGRSGGGSGGGSGGRSGGGSGSKSSGGSGGASRKR